MAPSRPDASQVRVFAAGGLSAPMIVNRTREFGGAFRLTPEAVGLHIERLP
jgi:hypothetical protein